MTIQVGNIFQFKDLQSFQGVNLENDYYYKLTAWDGTSNLNTVATRFKATVMDVVKTIQSPNLVHTGLKIINLSTQIEFHEEALNVAGTTAVTGDAAPSFLAATFKLVRSTLETRNGSKRIAGMVEGGFAGNTLALNTTAKNNVIAALSANIESLSGPSVFTFQPVIVGRTPSGDLNLAVTNVISSVAEPKLSTQNTRKR